MDPALQSVHSADSTTSYFPERGRKSGSGKPGSGGSDTVVIAISAGALVIAGGLYFLWQTPLQNPAPLPRRATTQSQRRSAPAASAAVDSKTGEADGEGRPYDNWAVIARGGHAAPGRSQRSVAVPGSPGSPGPADLFPTESDIEVGTLRANLMEAFGKPELSAHTLEQKRLMEVYVYLAGRDNATFVLMEEGKVVSVHTLRLDRSALANAQPTRKAF